MMRSGCLNATIWYNKASFDAAPLPNCFYFLYDNAICTSIKRTDGTAQSFKKEPCYSAVLSF
jgi:hypothetical protein